MDYIPFQTPGDACMYALRQHASLRRVPSHDTPIIVGIFAQLPTGQKFKLHRVETHYEWKFL